MPRVKFKSSGKWAQPQPHLPQLEVKAGDVLDLSPEMAASVVEAGRGEYVVDKQAPASKVTKKAEANPAKADKAQAEG